MDGLNAGAELVVMLAATRQYNARHVWCEAMQWEAGREHPIGCSGTVYDGLRLGGHITDFGTEARFVSHGVGVYSRYSLHAREAREIAALLARIERAFAKGHAFEAGDLLVAYCAALGVKRVCTPSKGEYGGGGWANYQWQWLTVPEARNQYRYLINREIEREAEARAVQAVRLAA